MEFGGCNLKIVLVQWNSQPERWWWNAGFQWCVFENAASKIEMIIRMNNYTDE